MADIAGMAVEIIVLATGTWTDQPCGVKTAESRSNTARGWSEKKVRYSTSPIHNVDVRGFDPHLLAPFDSHELYPKILVPCFTGIAYGSNWLSDPKKISIIFYNPRRAWKKSPIYRWVAGITHRHRDRRRRQRGFRWSWCCRQRGILASKMWVS